MENNPNVTIEFIDITYQRMREQALIMAQAGTAPDITEPVVSWVPQLAGAGILEPVSNFLSEAEIASYVSSPVAERQLRGRGLRRTVLARADSALRQHHAAGAGRPSPGRGGGHPRLPRPDRQDRLARHRQRGRNIIGFSLRNVKSANAAFWFTPWLWAWGGELVDGDNNATLDTDEFRRR